MMTPKNRAGELTELIMQRWLKKIKGRGTNSPSTSQYNAAYEAAYEILYETLYSKLVSK